MPESNTTPAELEVRSTTCCIVGGGPAGAVLALLLARQGVAVTLLEAHKDFERDFRGDTLHPSVLEYMDQLGLSERLLQLRHQKIYRLGLQTPQGLFGQLDFSRLKTRHPYITMMPQSVFLEFITAEAARYPGFVLLRSTVATELIEEAGVVRGVRYRGPEGAGELRALLTVGADGRGSKIRRAAGFEPVKTAPPMDVLWFHLPKRESDGEGFNGGRYADGRILIQFDRGDSWQFGCLIRKGSYQQMHRDGIDSLRRAVVESMPSLVDRVQLLSDWKDVAMLSVESSRVPKWYRSGLLLIGDAAHVMTPVLGVGINYAIQDAVVAANLLTSALKAGTVTERDLARVQQAREFPTRMIQNLQAFFQQNIIARALEATPDRPFRPPLLLRLPLLRRVQTWIGSRIIAFGVRRVRLEV